MSWLPTNSFIDTTTKIKRNNVKSITYRFFETVFVTAGGSRVWAIYREDSLCSTAIGHLIPISRSVLTSIFHTFSVFIVGHVTPSTSFELNGYGRRIRHPIPCDRIAKDGAIYFITPTPRCPYGGWQTSRQQEHYHKSYVSNAVRGKRCVSTPYTTLSEDIHR